MEKTIERQKEFSREFQEELLNLFEMCFENHTDSCTLTFEYSEAIMEVDFTFRVRSKDND